MAESNNIKQAKALIAYLKEQKENKDKCSTKLNNHFLKSTIATDSQSPLASINSQYCNNKSKESVSNKNEDIKNIINNLKAKNQQFSNDITGKTIGNFNTVHDSELNLTKSILNSSGEIIKKSNPDYLQKSNKRFKLEHTNSNKQSHLTEFYNVVKCVDNHGNDNSKYSCELYNKPSISNCATITKLKNQNEKSQLVENSTTSNGNVRTDFNNDKTLIDHTCRSEVNESVPSPQSTSKEKRMWDLFHNIKKRKNNQVIAKSNRSQDKVVAEKLNENFSIDFLKREQLKNASKRTVDDFCNDIMTNINNKLEDSKLKISDNLDNSSCKANIFLKSLSTGSIIPARGNQKDTNSLPITGYETKNVNKRLEGNTTFDDFIEKILKKITNRVNNENVRSTIHYSEVECSRSQENNSKGIAGQNVSNKLETFSNKESITPILMQQYNSNEIIQMTQYAKSQDSEIFIIDNVVDKDTNLSSKTNSHNNQHNDQQHYLRDDFKNVRQDMEICYSQFTQKNSESQQYESVNKVNELYTNFEKENSMMADLAKEKNSIDDIYNCIGTNCSGQKGISLEDSFERRIDFLDNGLEKSILTTTYRSRIKTAENDKGNVEPKKSFNLENFLKNIIPSTENKEVKRNVPDKCKFQVKRYRKGKTKIYKLKKLRKRRLETEVDEDLNFHDLLKKITTENCETQPRLSRYKSGSSISTCSSYIADDGKSDTLSTGSKELTSPQQRLRNGFNELSKDQSLRFSRNEWENVPELDKENAKMKIQDIFFQILEDFKHDRTSCLKHRRQSFDNCIFKDGRLQFRPVPESSMTIISSRAQRSKAKFQLMLYILKKIQTLLETDTKLTKRELYYQLKELISDQRVSDRAINAISCLLDVGMWALNIIAQKGLVFGDLKLLLSSGEILNCNIPGTLIPQDINEIVEVHSTAYFILVVEKESIFHKLIEEDLPNKLTRPFIMITGKGFPDLNTQLFLRKLWMVMSIPVFILVDADPHGINIMLNYRFGSVNNAHVSQHLAVPNAKWLGVYPSEITNMNIARQPLNEREIRLVNRMLETPYMEFSGKLVDELKVLLTKKFKAGIEGLIKTDSYLSEVYLPKKFFSHNFI